MQKYILSTSWCKQNWISNCPGRSLNHVQSRADISALVHWRNFFSVIPGVKLWKIGWRVTWLLYMDYRPSENRSWIFEWNKQRGILSLNQNPGLQNRPISLVKFRRNQPIKCSDFAFFSNIQDLSSEGL